MLTLYNVLNNHICRIGRRLDPLCSRCGEVREAPSHLFENCVTLVAITCFIFVSTTTTLEEVLHERRLEEHSRIQKHVNNICTKSYIQLRKIQNLRKPNKTERLIKGVFFRGSEL